MHPETVDVTDDISGPQPPGFATKDTEEPVSDPDGSGFVNAVCFQNIPYQPGFWTKEGFFRSSACGIGYRYILSSQIRF